MNAFSEKSRITENNSFEENIILSVKDIVVSFNVDEGRIRAVDGAGFNLIEGRSLGIVGESGCGKSVTALAVMGLLPRPSGRVESGSIDFKGDNLLLFSTDEMRKIRGRKIAMIFQEPMTALNPVQKIAVQMKEVYTVHFPGMSLKEIHEASADMLKEVGIADPYKVLQDYPHQLSGGMRQRIMIAMGLSSKPDILIADEPTTALDVTVQAQILDLIKKLRARMKMSVILITHDLGVIAENCDDAIVMYGGRVAEQADVKTLFKHPCHPYTRGLLESIPTLLREHKTILPTIKGRVPSLEEMPPGCRFCTRCSHVMDICRSIVPRKVTLSPGHDAWCHLYE